MAEQADGSILDSYFSKDEICVIESLKYLKNKKKGTDVNNIFKIYQQSNGEFDKILVEGLINNLIMTGVIIRKIHAGKTTHHISYDTVKELSTTRQESEKEEEIIPLDVLQVPLLSYFSNVMLEEVEEVIPEPFVINRNSHEFITKDEFESLKQKVDQLIESNEKNVLYNGNMGSKKEIEFLKNELKSKNMIIEILQQTVDSLERENCKVVHNQFNKNSQIKSQDEFITPKRFAKNRNKANSSIPIQTGNRFKHLIECDNDNNEHSQLETLDNKKSESNNGMNRKARRNENKKSITILGDSLLKDVKSFKLKNAINNTANIYVKSFSGATIDDMASYVIPTKKYNPDAVILHCGTNDLNTKDPKDIASKVIDLAKSLHTSHTTAVVSTLLPRNDNLDQKRIAINKHLQRECNQRNLAFIHHENIEKTKHLNKSGLYVNSIGTKLLSFNFLTLISDLIT